MMEHEHDLERHLNSRSGAVKEELDGADHCLRRNIKSSSPVFQSTQFFGVQREVGQKSAGSAMARRLSRRITTLVPDPYIGS